MATVKSSQNSLFKDLLVLSRFTKYNPVFTTFAGAFSCLLGGSAVVGPGSDVSLAWVFQQTALTVAACYAFCGAGMVWNDYIDRDIDANVARTKDRPLASGKVSTAQAMAWMAFQIIACWWILYFMLEGQDVNKNMFPAALGSFLYPYGKRPTMRKFYIYPQYILGFTIAWPAVCGRAAIFHGRESYAETVTASMPLLNMVFFWTIFLNTAYSYQDVVDDRKMGVNSFYNVLGKHVHLLLWLLLIPVAVCIPMYIEQFHSAWLWVSWAGVWALSLLRQVLRFDANDPSSGGGVHVDNFLLGAWTVVACAVELLRCYYA
ncbi:hypothetical protein PG994_004358 [Apiospora phragmitis]|uniref:Uncharacterized protein n=1 Tax=Apiospora phragmitis TaxID=2905665 RepID=A0ABR1VU83_9PEZI